MMPMALSKSPEETLRLGEEWGRAAKAGWLIGLVGDLGAGKTQLVKGIARGLGIAARIQSPTFTLVHEHRGGRLPLYHIDLYRLDTPGQIIGAGLEDYIYQRDGVAVIEWIDRFTFEPPGFYRRATLEPTGENQRRIVYEDFGA